jgi:UDP-N-acetylglucosamine 2-epimerase
MRIVSIVGARPQFVKLAVVARAISAAGAAAPARHQIVHTGQHYDFEMSEVFFGTSGFQRYDDQMSGQFFRDSDTPAPQYNLSVRSGSNARQTAMRWKRGCAVLGRAAPILLPCRERMTGIAFKSSRAPRNRRFSSIPPSHPGTPTNELASVRQA